MLTPGDKEMTAAPLPITPPNPTVTPAAGPAPVEPAGKPHLGRSPRGPRKSEEPVDLRLVIEEREDGRGFVYKTLDRNTGEVVQIYPREAIEKLGDSAEYRPGTVVDQRT